MEAQISEKPTWRQRTRARIKETHQKGWFICLGLSFLYLSLIALMIVLPLKLAGQVPPGSDDTNPNVRNNNNFLPSSCPHYTVTANGANPPFSDGPLKLPFQRPTNSCRTFTSEVMEKLITNVTARMVDPDLARIFENSYPNTLDTTISWYDLAEPNPLAYVITGDIGNEWLRDSSHQMVPYLPLLPYDKNLQALFRAVLNLQGQYIADQPYCNAFQPPPASGLKPNSVPGGIAITPKIDSTVYQCKWEIDSLASFLRLSWGYWEATNDTTFMSTNWNNAVNQIMTVLQEQSLPTVQADGTPNPISYTYQPTGSRATDQLILDGYGSPSAPVGLIRSSFRPSDDSTIFQLLIPANAMLSVNLHRLSTILNATNTLPSVSSQAEILSESIRTAIETHAIINSSSTGTEVYAYEIDGYGSINFMDDANVPSLMSLPYLGFTNATDPIYQSTRAALLSTSNPWWFHSPSANQSGIGGPHRGLHTIWPLNWIIQLSTSTDVSERVQLLEWIKRTTAGKGLIHESFDVGQASGASFTRLWFGWGNSLFGEVLLNMAMTEGELGADILFGANATALDLESVLGS